MAGEKSIELLETDSPFLTGPGDLLVEKICEHLLSVPQFKTIFGENIDSYERFDYPIRALPALRIYSLGYRKEHESHYIYGDVHLDVVLPPFLRRKELQKIQDLFGGALTQQFRRPTFFEAMREAVPGLNELGKTFDIDKESGLVFEEEILPLTRMVANFRLDLKVWDDFLEQDCRTKDEPFERTLKNLERIVTVIRGLNDEEVKQVELAIDQSTKGD